MASSFQAGPFRPQSANNSTWACVRFFAATFSFFTSSVSCFRSSLSSLTIYRLCIASPPWVRILPIGEKARLSVNPKNQS